jgi:LacI family transcriptional regulator
MKEANARPLIDMRSTACDYQSTSNAIVKHLKAEKPPEAIFCLKNSTTISTYSILQKMKISIPSQVALVGFDDFELASTLRPSITVVQQPVEELGHTAAKLLFQRLALPKGIPIHEKEKIKPIQLKTRLILRASCGCPEVEEPQSISASSN